MVVCVQLGGCSVVLSCDFRQVNGAHTRIRISKMCSCSQRRSKTYWKPSPRARNRTIHCIYASRAARESLLRSGWFSLSGGTSDPSWFPLRVRKYAQAAFAHCLLPEPRDPVLLPVEVFGAEVQRTHPTTSGCLGSSRSNGLILRFSLDLEPTWTRPNNIWIWNL